jgi:hypothetical protein
LSLRGQSHSAHPGTQPDAPSRRPARLVSIAVGGVLADTIGIRAVYVFGGALLLTAGLVGIARAGDASLVGEGTA